MSSSRKFSQIMYLCYLLAKKANLLIKYRYFYTCRKNLKSFEQESVKLLDHKIISIFLKRPEHLKWYKIFWKTQYMQILNS